MSDYTGTATVFRRHILLYLFILVTVFLLLHIFVFDHLATVNEWPEERVESVGQVFEILGVLALVLFTEWYREVAARHGVEVIGVAGAALVFAAVSTHLLVAELTHPAAAVGITICAAYLIQLRHWNVIGRLRPGGVSRDA